MKLARVFGLAILALCLPALSASGQGGSASGWHVASSTVVTQEVRFQSRGATLVGTLSLPVAGSNLPAIVVTHGADAPTRDDALYTHLAEDLPRLGYAVFVFDRRGSGASGGSLDQADYEMLADDAVAAQHAIAKIPRIAPRHIGFWGLSQGGWLGILAASRSPDAAFVISISGPFTTPAEQMAFTVRNILTLRGFSPSQIQQALDFRHAFEGYLRGSVSRAAAQAVADKAAGQPWFKDVFLPAKLPDDRVNSSWRKEMDYDPKPPLLKLKVPTLILYGSDDPWVPVEASVSRLKPIVAGKPNLTLRVIANANHALAAPSGENMAHDPAAVKAEAPTSPEYFLLLGDWLERLRTNWGEQPSKRRG